MAKNPEAFKHFIRDLRSKGTGCVIFTDDDGTGSPTIEFSKSWKSAKAGQVVGAVQMDADRIYVSGRKFNTNRMKALRKGIKDGVSGRLWVITLQEALAAGYVVDPAVAADDNPEFDDAPELPPQPATSSTHFDEPSQASLPQPGASAARPAKPGSDDDDNDDADDDGDDDDAPSSGKEKVTAAERQDPKLAEIAKRIELVLPKWAGLRDRLLASGPAAAGREKVEQLDRALGGGRTTVGVLINRSGDKARATLEGILARFVELAALAKAAPAAPAHEYDTVNLDEGSATSSSSAASEYADPADIRTDGRYDNMLENWPDLCRWLFSFGQSVSFGQSPRGSSRVVAQRTQALDAILRPVGSGEKCLTMVQVRQKYGPDFAEVMDAALADFNWLAKWKQDNPELVGNEVAALREARLRVLGILPKLPALLDRLDLTDPDNATRTQMNRLEELAFKDGRNSPLTADEILDRAGGKATAVLDEVSQLFAELEKLERGGAGDLSSSGSARSTDGEKAPDPAQAEVLRKAQALRGVWDDRIKPILRTLVTNGHAPGETVRRLAIEFEQALGRDERGLQQARTILETFLKLRASTIDKARGPG